VFFRVEKDHSFLKEKNPKIIKGGGGRLIKNRIILTSKEKIPNKIKKYLKS